MADATTIFPNDLNGKAVLVTGGTKGIGLATGLSFGAQGARVYLTHRWGSADEDVLRSQFKAVGAPEPVILEADASNDEDTEAVMQRIKADCGTLEVLISNVSFAHISKHHSDLSKKGLKRSLNYSAWPFVGYLQQAKLVTGRFPRYAVGMSSRGPEYFLPGYDFIAVSKAVMETFMIYMTAELASEDVRINVIRANPVNYAQEAKTLLADIASLDDQLAALKREQDVPAPDATDTLTLKQAKTLSHERSYPVQEGNALVKAFEKALGSSDAGSLAAELIEAVSRLEDEPADARGTFHVSSSVARCAPLPVQLAQSKVWLAPIEGRCMPAVQQFAAGELAAAGSWTPYPGGQMPEAVAWALDVDGKGIGRLEELALFGPGPPDRARLIEQLQPPGAVARSAKSTPAGGSEAASSAERPSRVAPSGKPLSHTPRSPLVLTQQRQTRTRGLYEIAVRWPCRACLLPSLVSTFPLFHVSTRPAGHRLPSCSEVATGSNLPV